MKYDKLWTNNEIIRGIKEQTYHKLILRSKTLLTNIDDFLITVSFYEVISSINFSIFAFFQ